LLEGARWPSGQGITIRFLGDDVTRFGAAGAQALRTRVMNVARKWTDIANLTFEVVADGGADIRIAFIAGDGSWSYLGTECRRIPEPEPTMNYGWLTPASPEEELRRVVLHEFGHALGLIHEHQNPNGGIEWDRQEVIKDLSGPPNFWPMDQIENNMFRKYAGVVGTPVDDDSIMMYPIPERWTIGDFSADLNSEISPRDRKFVRDAYPQ
jgi:hypothetical protein